MTTVLQTVVLVISFGIQQNPPASPQAKTTPPATHFTQGTIASIAADRVVLNQTVRGKSQQVAFVLNSKTKRSGHLAIGTRVTVQYRENNNQKIAAAVREFQPKATNSTKAGPPRHRRARVPPADQRDAD